MKATDMCTVDNNPCEQLFASQESRTSLDLTGDNQAPKDKANRGNASKCKTSLNLESHKANGLVCALTICSMLLAACGGSSSSGTNPTGLPVADPLQDVQTPDTNPSTGSTNSIPRMTPQAAIDLAGLDGSNGYTLEGANADDWSGFGMGMVGDFNNDGVDDFAIGSYRADIQGVENAGQAYVIFGTAGSVAPRLPLSSLNGTNGFALSFTDPADLVADDRVGLSISSAGDMNNDGISDVFVTRYQGDLAGNQAGDAYVVFGTSSAMPAVFDLGSIDGTNGFSIVAADGGDRLGLSANTAGDFNNDGTDDLIIGSHQADENGNRSGAAYVIYGSPAGYSATAVDLDNLDGSNGFEMNGAAAGDEAGGWVSGGSDVNGDGIDDVLVGARFSDSNGADSGSAYIVFGTSENNGASIELSALDGSNGFEIRGANTDDQLGISAEPAGDFNNDGIADILVGAHNHDALGRTDSGAAYIIYGKTEFSAVTTVSALMPTEGLTILGAEIDDSLAKSVHAAGDVDGDGIHDIVAGAENHNSNGRSKSGRTYVIYGHSTPQGTENPATEIAGKEDIPAALDLRFLDETQGYFINGVTNGDKSGRMVKGGMDINNDGLDDILVGAPQADPAGKIHVGESYLAYGTLVSGNNSQTLLTSNTELAASGVYVVEDANQADSVIITVESAALSGATGSLVPANVLPMLTMPGNALDSYTSINTIEWEFRSGSQHFGHLGPGQTMTVTYTVRATDNSVETAFVDDFVTIVIVGN